MMFKAAYYKKTGEAEEVLKLGLFEVKDPKVNEIQIEIVVSGINHSDIKIRRGARGAIDFSYLIPHSDGAGIIKKMGSSVSGFSIGDRVWVYNAAWLRNHGTASALVNLPQELVVPLVDKASFELGACLGIPALTAATCLLALNSANNGTIMVTGWSWLCRYILYSISKNVRFESYLNC